MDIGFSIEMVIWVAVGGRASLIGAIIGALVVNFARSFLSEKFPEVWLFFQGALFLLIVTVVPDGLVGWLRYRSVDQVRSLLGLQKQLATYPRLEVDPEVENERKNFE
ncbi:ABC transporter permease subunit [Neosynechococcus sphagnicola]|uniref:ABC transporter permease subunit n=1 Tax=Neosynechococcus sphagnicola TaxID=1501145 RepID=UPI0030844ABB